MKSFNPKRKGKNKIKFEFNYFKILEEKKTFQMNFNAPPSKSFNSSNMPVITNSTENSDIAEARETLESMKFDKN